MAWRIFGAFALTFLAVICLLCCVALGWRCLRTWEQQREDRIEEGLPYDLTRDYSPKP
ncbi:hypothetical protein OESDEN_11704 [Oesophagostomum dentatum]|uniref:Uncharacterized protein n=1 Tax=Oesophagostomum dentatum TaxID=61180 RepID=A0A0B1SZ87_OESDE|nr:hypothetical protein OESDEN_11704 [Oesophagostomum dentatum]